MSSRKRKGRKLKEVIPMSEQECAAVLVFVVTIVQVLIMAISFICQQGSQRAELLPKYIPPCPPKKKKENE